MHYLTHIRSDVAPALILPSGARLAIRPLEVTDRDRLAALFTALSARSRHQRFFGPKPVLSERELDHLAHVDHVDHEALAAIDAGGAIVAVVRYARDARRRQAADVAAEVRDDWQRMGIATALGARLIHRAELNGLTTLAATVLWENTPARALMRRLGFRAHRSAGAVLDLELDLTTRCPPEANLGTSNLGSTTHPNAQGGTP